MIVFRWYISLFAGFLLVFLGLAAGFDYVVDPYGFFEAPVIRGWTAVKPEQDSHSRMWKAMAVRRLRPQALALGTSRIEYALDPAHPGWKAQPVFNLGLSAASLRESFLYLRHAHAIRPIKQVVFGADMFVFSAAGNFGPRLDDGDMAVSEDGATQGYPWKDMASALVSLDTLFASARTIRSQTEPSLVFLPNGQRDSGWMRTEKMRIQGGHHRAFLETEEAYVKGWWTPFYKPSPFVDNAKGQSAFDLFGRMLAFCHTEGIEIIVVIPPLHARMLTAMDVAGLRPVYEFWKRELTLTAAQTNRRFPNTHPVVLWDFSNINAYTVEQVPRAGDSENRMRWFWESSHIKKELGDILLDRVFGLVSPSRKSPSDFGVILTPENLEGRLAQERKALIRWQHSHPDETAEIKAMVNRIGPVSPRIKQPS
ncbi:MAG: hypothetical protein OEW12_04470 [Deltaproteobacteria bacterium]|nr:hypothetical protein [Deltaproteobacteria bacterium]